MALAIIFFVIAVVLFGTASSGLVALRDPGSDGDSTTVASDSGLEFINNELTVIRGCADSDQLTWDEVNDEWECGAGGGGGVFETVEVTKDFSLSGTGRVKLESRIGTSQLTAGNTAPTSEITESIGAAGNLLIPTLAFDPSSNPTDEEVFITGHVLENVDGTVDAEFHLMWKPDSTWAGGNYYWALEYLVTTETADTTAGAPTIIFESVTPANATDLIETEFTATIDAGPQDLIHGRVYLDASNSTAVTDGHIYILEGEFYIDKLGEPIADP